MSKVTLCGIAYDVQTPADDLTAALTAVGTRTFIVCTPNAEIAGRALHDAKLRTAINGADLVLPDGDGVVLAGKLAHRTIPARRTGAAFAEALLTAANENGLRVYLLGGTAESLYAAAARVIQQYPRAALCGKHNGYFNVYDAENSVIIEDISRAKPDITLVCMGAPRQEIWMAENRHRLPPGIYGGFGGVIDLLAGETTRAPAIWQRLHVEWLYRTLCQPARLRRLTAIPPYLYAAWRSRTEGKT